MGGFPKYYSKMHVTVDNMDELIEDIENKHIEHLQDFHPGSQGGVLTTTYGTSAQLVFEDVIAPSLTVNVSAGVSYSQDFNRIDTKVAIVGEVQLSVDSTTVNTTNPIADVTGVFVDQTGSGVNYALGGSFDSTGKTITLGTALPSHPQNTYVNYDRMANYTFTDPPTGVAGLDIIRIDLLYLEYEKTETNPFAIDFITANRQLIQEVNYTREVDDFSVKILQGVQVVAPAPAVAPDIPDSDVVVLAYVHHRANTSAIYDSDQSTISTSYIEDIRSTI